MQLSDFLAYHLPGLETNEAKHNVILGILAGIGEKSPEDLHLWTLGSSGQCAVQTRGRAIVLGELEEAQCHGLVEEVKQLAFPGVVGPDQTAKWFADRAIEVGLEFHDAIPQQILALTEKPNHPAVPGHARPVGTEDAALLADWLLAFMAEATPHDPLPARERLERLAGEGRHHFWVIGGRPVSMAGIVRRTRNAAAIAAVYTPPSLRGRGYAGSVTAAVVERVFAEGKSTACLYVDLRNPFSRRWYAKIGFTPVRASWHFPRTLRRA
jgi:RimJ/RimL family protein N-acetyltransferase